MFFLLLLSLLLLSSGYILPEVSIGEEAPEFVRGLELEEATGEGDAGLLNDVDCGGTAGLTNRSWDTRIKDRCIPPDIPYETITS